MRLASLSVLVALCAGVLVGCGDSQAAPSGVTEPMRVAKAQFIEGAFPTGHDSGPEISQITLRSNQFVAGTTGKLISGLAAAGSQSVAFGLQGFGTGYWVLPVGSPALQDPGSFEWSATCDFSLDLPAGKVPFQVAASDSNGHFGPIATQPLNILSLIPTAHVVASLTWGADMDLDLHLVTPSGKELDPKQPNTIGSDETTGKPLPHSGLLDRDSLAACIPDGARTENVAWADDPEVGTYTVRVDMFSPCSKPAATFVFSLYVDGAVVLKKTGRLLDIDADGGGLGSGLFVTEFSCLDDGTCGAAP